MTYHNIKIDKQQNIPQWKNNFRNIGSSVARLQGLGQRPKVLLLHLTLHLTFKGE